MRKQLLLAFHFAMILPILLWGVKICELMSNCM
jgi:hypothetical protein